MSVDEPGNVNAQAEDITQRIVELLQQPLTNAIRDHLLVNNGGLVNAQLHLEGLIRDDQEGRDTQAILKRIVLVSLLCFG
jgi:hypothetical protein